MQLDPGGRWSLHSIVVGCVGAGAIMVFPTHLEIGWTLIGGGLLTSALAELNQRWPAPLEAIAGRLRTLPLIGARPVAYMPFAEACRELYQADLNGWLGTAARQDAGDGEHSLRWCAYWIAPRFQEIYGRRPPSTVLELIPPDLFTYAHFSDDVGALAGGPSRDYVDLAVPQKAFREAIPMLIDNSWTSGP